MGLYYFANVVVGVKAALVCKVEERVEYVTRYDEIMGVPHEVPVKSETMFFLGREVENLEEYLGDDFYVDDDVIGITIAHVHQHGPFLDEIDRDKCTSARFKVLEKLLALPGGSEQPLEIKLYLVMGAR